MSISFIISSAISIDLESLCLYLKCGAIIAAICFKRLSLIPLYYIIIGLTNPSTLCIINIAPRKQDEQIEPDNVYKGKDQDRTWTSLKTVLKIKDKDKFMDTNLTWSEGNTWYGWTYSLEKNCYYFDDIGDESLGSLWNSEFLMQAY